MYVWYDAANTFVHFSIYAKKKEEIDIRLHIYIKTCTHTHIIWTFQDNDNLWVYYTIYRKLREKNAEKKHKYTQTHTVQIIAKSTKHFENILYTVLFLAWQIHLVISIWIVFFSWSRWAFFWSVFLCAASFFALFSPPGNRKKSQHRIWL